MGLRSLSVALAFVFLTGCASIGSSRYIGHQAFSDNANLPLDAVNAVVLIYNHGSLSEDKRDPCFPDSGILPGGMPDIVRGLSGKKLAGKSVYIYALCSEIPGRLKLRDSAENLKIRLRMDEIIVTVQRFRALGVPSEQIFLLGHSAGGWASLLIEREDPELVNAVVAFAPAFAGMKHRRNKTWQRFRDQHQRHLSAGKNMRGLVYAFPGDSYNTPADLAFFARIPYLEFQPLALPQNVAARSCYRGHRAVFRRCFSQAHGVELRDFLQRQLAY